MRAHITALMIAISVSGCSQSDPTPKLVSPIQKTQSNVPAKDASIPTDDHSNSKGNGYIPPTAEEMAPMRSEYIAELAKIHEPPEMAGRPMQVRKAVSPSVVKLENVMTAVGSPEKATHQQRVTAIREILEIANNNEQDSGVDRAITYGAVAAIACLDGVDPQTIIGYASNAIGDGNDGLALRARMYLRAGDRTKALDDLEKVMADGDSHVLTGGEVDPRKNSAPCGWSIADFDALGDDPRALAAKGLYLSSFIAYGAENRGAVKDSDIRDLYARSAKLWHSPIPHFLITTVNGFGSQQSMTNASCIRGTDRRVLPKVANACAALDEGVRSEIRELTMALVIDPKFASALAKRADKYLELAQSSYADNKPSRQLFELAIKDFTAAIAANGKNLHTLYCDRALALASIGKYQDAVSSYIRGMKYAKDGVEDSPFVYEQLAGLYMKMGKFTEATDLMTQALINSTAGINSVIVLDHIKAFRVLYPEYDLLPDEILAEVVRRRYQPQFPQSWNADFISQSPSGGAVFSSILPELYVLRGDAYMKAERRAEAAADYRRVESDVWGSDEHSMPRHFYFDEHGLRKFDLPEPWPPSPPTM